jgi:protein SCO1
MSTRWGSAAWAETREVLAGARRGGVGTIRRRGRWLAALVTLTLLVGACSPTVPLAGTDLGAVPASDFALPDAAGGTVQLAALRGQPVVLTFLFTQCPDICPLTAQKLRQTADRLGSASGQVALVAVSTDPANDDAAAATAFVEKHGLAGRLRYLIGSQADLQPVWAAYHMYVATEASANPAEQAMARQAGRAVHTDAIYLIDRQGRERSLLRSDFDPDALAASLKRLLAE